MSGKNQLAPESLLSLAFPSDPQISPDGKQVVFVLAQIDEEDRLKPDPDFARPRYRSHLWYSDGGKTGDSAARQLTYGESGRGDLFPRWSPDGQTLAFIRSVGEVKGALMLMPAPGSSAAGGEARRVTHFKNGVSGLQWSPDGRYISFLTAADAEDKRDERGEARIITRPIYRFNGRDWLPEKPAELWRYDTRKDQLEQWHTPEQELGSYDWLPDSSGVLFVSSSSAKAAYQWQNEVFSLNLKGKVKQVSNWGGAIGQVVAHPDGEHFAITGRPAGTGNTQHSHLYLLSLQPTEKTGKKTDWQRLDQGHAHPVGNLVGGDCHVGAMPEKPVWLDRNTLLFSSTVRGSAGLFRATLSSTGNPGKGGTVTPHTHDGQEVIAAFTANAGGIALLRESPTRFPEVELNGKHVTNLNKRLSFTPLAPEHVSFSTELGEGEGWVILPADKPQNKKQKPAKQKTGKQKKVPALLNIHGGPHTDYGYAFTHEFQLFAANGYGVCYSNPRGSVGYGQKWVDDIHGRWGTVDMADLLNFFDQCLQSFPQLDGKNSAVMGGSYGGFMTNWITGHTTRFKAAITDRCICNLLSFNGTSDIGLRFWQDELGLNFNRSADAAKLWEMSPLKYAENVETPTLIVHSVLDHRCPIEQAEQWYAALTLQDVPVRFVRFPGEDHELSRSGRPDRRLTRLHEYLNWLGRWLD